MNVINHVNFVAQSPIPNPQSPYENHNRTKNYNLI